LQRPDGGAHGDGQDSEAEAGAKATLELAPDEEQVALAALHTLLEQRAAAAGNAAPAGAQATMALPTDAILAGLSVLQAAAQPIAAGGRAPQRGLADIKQSLLRHVRAQHGPNATLAPGDADTFDLLGLLYAEVEREV